MSISWHHADSRVNGGFHPPTQIQTVRYGMPPVNIRVPQVYGLSNPAAESAVNRQILQQAQSLHDQQVQAQIPGTTEMDAYYEIKTNERNVLSLIQVNGAYTPPMAHGMTFAGSLTFTLEDGKHWPLSELFKPGAAYVERLSELVAAQIRERDVPVLEPFRQIRPDQDYYLADKSIVIYFQLYELSPYYVGFPMFPISLYAVQDLIREGSPADRLLAST
jgi:hypothetical protein